MGARTARQKIGLAFAFLTTAAQPYPAAQADDGNDINDNDDQIGCGYLNIHLESILTGFSAMPL